MVYANKKRKYKDNISKIIVFELRIYGVIYLTKSEMRKDIIMFLTLGISIITLLFGYNIISFFTKSSVEVETIYPLVEVPVNSQSVLVGDLGADSLQLIRLKNKGLSNSTKLVITIEAQGRVLDCIIKSYEEVHSVEYDDNKVVLRMDRLSRNVPIDIELWMINEDIPININCIDDDGSKELVLK